MQLKTNNCRCLFILHYIRKPKFFFSSFYYLLAIIFLFFMFQYKSRFIRFSCQIGKLSKIALQIDSSDQLIETPTLKYQKIPISGNRACPPCWLFRGIWLVFLYRGLHWLFFCVNMYMYVYIPAADVFAHLPFSILHLAFLLTLTLRLSPFFTDTYVGLRSADTYVFLPLFLRKNVKTQHKTQHTPGGGRNASV